MKTGASDLLATIVAATRRVLDVRQSREPLDAVARRAERRTVPAPSFRESLEREGVRVIAECKRRSPARGVLRHDYEPVAIASSYGRHGAAAVSVLTEPTFFDGSLEHLTAVAEAVAVPVLRKDFVVSEYQLFEAKAAGAAAALLIVAALSDAELRLLLARSRELGLDALVEVHDDDELTRAVDAGARIVGVNNRNLRTLEVEFRASEGLIARMPRDVVAVSESGLKTAGDLLRLRALGYRGFLVGERFMTADDPGEALRALLQGCAQTAGESRGAARR
jgi:indole-3-glycerol phosphate synthase